MSNQRDRRGKNIKESLTDLKTRKIDEFHKEKEKNFEIKEKMDNYQKILIENQKLRVVYKSKKKEQEIKEQQIKKSQQQQNKLKEDLVFEKNNINYIDDRINQLQKHEEQLIDKLSHSITQRAQYKCKLTELISGNSKVNDAGIDGAEESKEKSQEKSFVNCSKKSGQYSNSSKLLLNTISENNENKSLKTNGIEQSPKFTKKIKSIKPKRKLQVDTPSTTANISEINIANGNTKQSMALNYGGSGSTRNQSNLNRSKSRNAYNGVTLKSPRNNSNDKVYHREYEENGAINSGSQTSRVGYSRALGNGYGGLNSAKDTNNQKSLNFGGSLCANSNLSPRDTIKASSVSTTNNNHNTNTLSGEHGLPIKNFAKKSKYESKNVAFGGSFVAQQS